MASTGPAPRVQAYGNGHGHPPTPGLNARRYADFYNQLAQLRDQVLAGKHPHFKIPDHVLEKFAVQSRPSPTSRVAANGPTNGTLPHPLPPHPLGHSPNKPTPTHASSRSASAQHPSVPKPLSEIDPVLLTKSDDLIRAEIQLKRQRVERLLKDQVEQRRVQSKDRDATQDVGPELDVAEILAKVQDKVPPLSALPQETNANSPASDSFDENSYYSSQANSWSSEESGGNASAADGVEAPLSRVANGNSDFTKNNGLCLSQRELHDDLNLVDDGEESDYEPPGAEAFAPVPPPADPLQPVSHRPGANGASAVQSSSTHVSGLDTSQGSGVQYPVESAQSSPRNANRGKRNASRNDNEPRSGRQSPAAPRNQNNNSRKRRREQKEAQKEPQRRNTNTNKRIADSPEPYIKEEPVSPPPLGTLPESSSDAARRGRAGPDDVEIISPRETRPPVYYVEYEQPPHARRYEMEPEVVRVPSRVAYRRVAERDDHDLRRYASLQYARRPYSPQPIPYEPVRYIEAPPSAAPIYREGSVRPSPRYIRSERSLSPPYGPDPYQRMRTPALMAPPPRPRRIVVDQYGNRYYAEPAIPDMRASMAPPTRVRSGAVEEMMYEHPRARAPTLQPVTRAVDYEDEGVQRMPPPQHRRFYDEADLEPVDVHRGYRQRDYSMRPVDREPLAPRDDLGPPPPAEPLDRRPFRYDDMPPPSLPPARDFAGRSYSVRPEALGSSRRDVPTDYHLSRHGSVAPRGEYPRRAAAGPAIEQQLLGPPPPIAPPPQQRAYREVSVVGSGGAHHPAGEAAAPPPAAPPYDDHRHGRYAGMFALAPPPPPVRGSRYADEPDLLERASPMVDAGYMFNGEAVPRVAYRY
ncbi:hypothetical protein BKA80DRAFT_263627 [Phyllosticta citrichinensis]